MARSNRSKSSERVVGKGKVTPVQVAFLVDRYLCDNRFLETRSIFRSEASSLISKSPLREAPCSLIPLGDILNDYISLKEHKVTVDQEKTRVQNLLHGMQNVMNAYNSTASALPPPAITTAAHAATQMVASTSQPNNISVSPSGGSGHNTPNLMSASLPGNKRVGNFTAPSSQSITKKRKSPEVSLEAAPTDSNKGRKKIPRAAKVDNNVANESSVITSSVAKCLFDSSDLSPPTNPSCLSTPQSQVSPQSDSNAKMSSKRDHVKGRLNFDDAEATMNLSPPASGDFVSTSSSGSEAEVDLFDIDFLSENFPFSEVLVDFDIACQGMPDPCLPQPSNCSFQLA
uniref:LisH domain-containing protein n=1 Tax=Brassica campestris TaxID=3711 RepID=M4CLQ9_BRACM